MKKQFWFLGVMILVLLFSGCGKKEPEAGKENLSDKPEMAQKQSEEKEGLFSGTIKDLLAKGTSQVCSWSFTDGEMGNTSGKIYLSGEKFYQEFKITGSPQGEMESYVINDGEWIYQWNSITNMGTKINAKEAEKLGEEAAAENQEAAQPEAGGKMEAVDWDKQMNYQCQNWATDEAKFKVPENIQFTDLNQMLNSIQENAGQMVADTCKICENLPGEAKTECLKNCQQ